MTVKEHAQRGVRFSLISLFLVLAFCSAGIGIAGAEPVMSIIPSTTNVNVGDDFSVFIEVNPAGYTLQQAHTDFIFDSSKVSILEVVDCGTFEFMFSNGTLATGIIDDIMGLSQAGVSSTGDLAEIRMHADNPGTFTIGLSDAGVGTATETLTPEVNNGTVSIEIPPTPTPTPTPAPAVVHRGGGGGAPKDTDGDGYTDIQEMLAGTDKTNPCDPDPESAACLAVRPATPTPAPVVTPTPTPAVTPTVPPSVPTPTPTPTPTPPPTVIPWFWIIIAIVAAAIIVSVIYVLRQK